MSPAPKRPRIMVIDDTSVNLAVLLAALKAEFDVQVFDSAEAALPVLAAQEVDLILLDVMMPGMDGYMAFERIRALPLHALTPIIFITASDDRYSEHRGLALGAADFIFKPLRLELVKLRIRNILRLATLDRHLKASEERFRYVMAATGEGIWDWTVSDGWVVHNRAWCSLLGLDDDALSHTLEFFTDLIHPEDFDKVQRALYACLHGSAEDYAQQYRLRHASGQYLWVEDRGRVVARDVAGQPLRMVGSIRDIDQRKKDEARIHSLAFYDPLTELPNRRLCMDRLHQALLKARRTHETGAVLFIDMDRFKELNDTHGHAMGDALLIQVGNRLRAGVRKHNTVARLGGDEFVVLLEGLGEDAADALERSERVAKNILEALNEPYNLDSLRYTSTPSIGLALFDGGSESTDAILAAADRAMYAAKAAGRNTYCVERTVAL